MIIMGDLNGDLGNYLGDKGCYAPNDRGLRLLDFANYFNLCPVNLLSICSGPLETLFLIVGGLNRQLIIFYCLTVYMTALFLVKRFSRLLRIHPIISRFN